VGALLKREKAMFESPFHEAREIAKVETTKVSTGKRGSEGHEGDKRKE